MDTRGRRTGTLVRWLLPTCTALVLAATSCTAGPKAQGPPNIEELADSAEVVQARESAGRNVEAALDRFGWNLGGTRAPGDHVRDTCGTGRDAGERRYKPVVCERSVVRYYVASGDRLDAPRPAAEALQKDGWQEVMTYLGFDAASQVTALCPAAPSASCTAAGTVGRDIGVTIHVHESFGSTVDGGRLPGGSVAYPVQADRSPPVTVDATLLDDSVRPRGTSVLQVRMSQVYYGPPGTAPQAGLGNGGAAQRT